MECFRLLLEHLAWIEQQLLSGIRDSRKAGSLWGMMRGVGGVRKSIDLSWFAKGLGLGLGLLSGQWHFDQDNAPVHNSILVTDYLTKIGIKIVPQPPYSPDLAPCEIWLFPKLRGCYKTIEEIKEALTIVIDTLTQEDFHGASGTVQQVHCSRSRLLRRWLEFHMFNIILYMRILSLGLQIDLLVAFDGWALHNEF